MQLINNIDIYNKKVLIRVDFNVPIENKRILSDFRLIKTLKTIKYCIDQKAKIILMSHLGRPKEYDRSLSLYPVYKYLVNIFKSSNIFFSDNCVSEESFLNSENLGSGDIHLLENLRFHMEELDDNIEFAKKLSKHGDVYINDAFGTAHRKHSSNSSILKYFTTKGIGFLMEQEIRYLSNLDLKTNNKMVLLLGGAKISSKLTVIEYFLNKSNYILIGGAMSFTFLKALGYNVGHSLVEDGMIDIAKSILNKSSTSKAKIILPIDFMCSNKNDGSCIFRNLDNIQNNDIGFDIGKGTIKLFKDIVSKANLILWNGPLGLFENKKYSLGTTALAEFISSLTFEKSIKSIVGGGDTANAIISLHMENNFTHISTGGGASLELLSGKKLQILESWESYE